MFAKRASGAVLTVLAVVLAAAPCWAGFDWDVFGHRGIKGSGDLETRELDLPPFERIVLECGLDIDVQVGGKRSAAVTLDDNLLDEFVAEVKDRTLRIDWRHNCRPSRECRLDLTVPSLAEVVIDGAGDVDVGGIAGERFAVEINGAGDMELDGEVDRFELEINGAGDVDADRLLAREVSVRVSGAGDAEVHATERLEAEVSGVGDVTYAGSPEEREVRVHGVGSVRRR